VGAPVARQILAEARPTRDAAVAAAAEEEENEEEDFSAVVDDVEPAAAAEADATESSGTSDVLSVSDLALTSQQ